MINHIKLNKNVFFFLLEMFKHTAFHFYRVGIISMLKPWR